MTCETVGRDANRLIRRIVDDMERCGIVSLVTEYEEPQTRPLIIQGSDGGSDIYFPYNHDDAPSSSLPLPPKSCLRDFAISYQKDHPTAIFSKGSIQTHYCAWPMPAIKSLGKSGSNFATWEGHVYRWNAMPFDRPYAANAWQYYVQHFLNAKFPFVMFYLTTFVICASDAEDAEKKTMELLDEIEDRGWRVTLPRIGEWTSNIEDLKPETLYCGIEPV